MIVDILAGLFLASCWIGCAWMYHDIHKVWPKWWAIPFTHGALFWARRLPKRWESSWAGLHMCALDRECRSIQKSFFGIVHRVEFGTDRYHFGFAYLPGSRYARVGGRSTWTHVRRKG